MIVHPRIGLQRGSVIGMRVGLYGRTKKLRTMRPWEVDLQIDPPLFVSWPTVKVVLLLMDHPSQLYNKPARYFFARI